MLPAWILITRPCYVMLGIWRTLAFSRGQPADTRST
jgi:hypothetical protein